MANAQKGEVSFEALGQTWTMKLGTNAMCELEDLTGKGIIEIGEMFEDERTFTLNMLRQMFFCSLLDHHENVSLRKAGSLVDELGMGEAIEKLRGAFLAALPEQKGKTAKGNRKAARS